MKSFEELKDIIEDYIDFEDVYYEGGSAKYNEAWKELEEAYEKQIPKKPIQCMPIRRVNGKDYCFDDDNYYKCPNCQKEIIMANINKPCCMFCGQRLDRNEE